MTKEQRSLMYATG